MKAIFPLITGNEVVPGLFQLEGRAARGVLGKLEARNAHRPHRRIARVGHAEEDFPTALEGQQQTWLAGVLHQLAGLEQRLAQRRLELLAEVRQFLAVVGIEHFQPETAAHRIVRQVFQNHADPVGFRQLKEAATSPLAREDQLGKAQAGHQPGGTGGVAADEFGAGTAGLGLGITGHVEARGMLGDLGADLAFEAGPAMHEEGVQFDSPGCRQPLGRSLSKTRA